MFSDHTKALLRSMGSGSLGEHKHPPWHGALTGHSYGHGYGGSSSSNYYDYEEEPGPHGATAFQRTLPLVGPAGSGAMSAGATIVLSEPPGSGRRAL